MMSGGGGLVKAEEGVLNAEQQEKLRLFKIQTRMDNEKYLRAHPEVDVLIRDFLRDVLHKRPADVRQFAADHFTNPNLQAAVESRMKENLDLE